MSSGAPEWKAGRFRPLKVIASETQKRCNGKVERASGGRKSTSQLKQQRLRPLSLSFLHSLSLPLCLWRILRHGSDQEKKEQSSNRKKGRKRRRRFSPSVRQSVFFSFIFSVVVFVRRKMSSPYFFLRFGDVGRRKEEREAVRVFLLKGKKMTTLPYILRQAVALDVDTDARRFSGYVARGKKSEAKRLAITFFDRFDAWSFQFLKIVSSSDSLLTLRSSSHSLFTQAYRARSGVPSRGDDDR